MGTMSLFICIYPPFRALVFASILYVVCEFIANLQSQVFSVLKLYGGEHSLFVCERKLCLAKYYVEKEYDRIKSEMK